MKKEIVKKTNNHFVKHSKWFVLSKIRQTKSGFSIGEVMIATFILLVGIVGAILLTAKSVGNIGDSRKAITAALLAQEGTELVRSVRDNSVTQQTCGSGSERCTAFDGDGTGYGWPSLSLGEGGVACSIDYTLNGDGKLNCHEATAKENLYLNKDTGLYSHSSGGNSADTHLKRKVFIKYETTTGVNSTSLTPDEIDKLVARVTSVVVWGNGDLPVSANNITSECKISKKCAFSQTRLTSWINY